MTKKIISITTRWPRTKDERRYFGRTDAHGDIVEIFINKPMNHRNHDLLDTVYHELTHAVIALYKTGFSGRREEKLCRAVGKAVVEAFRNA